MQVGIRDLIQAGINYSSRHPVAAAVQTAAWLTLVYLAAAYKPEYLVILIAAAIMWCLGKLRDIEVRYWQDLREAAEKARVGQR